MGFPYLETNTFDCAKIQTNPSKDPKCTKVGLLNPGSFGDSDSLFTTPSASPTIFTAIKVTSGRLKGNHLPVSDFDPPTVKSFTPPPQVVGQRETTPAFLFEQSKTIMTPPSPPKTKTSPRKPHHPPAAVARELPGARASRCPAPGQPWPLLEHCFASAMTKGSFSHVGQI